MAITGISFYLQWEKNIWWSWLVPVVIQTPAALVWSVGYQYFVENRKRRQLRQAFASYLSPYMADRIADSAFDPRLGGELMETTVMFTDLEGFTAMSETLQPPESAEIFLRAAGRPWHGSSWATCGRVRPWDD